MSHMIQNTRLIQSKLILNVPSKEVVAPRFKNILMSTLLSSKKGKYPGVRVQKRKSTLNKCHRSANPSVDSKKQFQQNCWREEVMLNNFCNKLTEKQLDNVRAYNQGLIKIQFSKLKNKLRKSVSNSRNSVLTYFDSNANQKRLDTILNMNYNQNIIEVQKKHQNKIMNKIYCMKEARDIDQAKQNYRKWLNTKNNQASGSPNLRKMNFVLQRIANKNDDESQKYFRIQRKTDTDCTNNKTKNDKEYIAGLMRKTQHSSYSPKSYLEDPNKTGIMKKVR